MEGTMPTEAKREAVAGLREQLEGSRTLIVSEYRGLTVREIGEIRRSLRKQDVAYRVVKNRLMKIAAADASRSALDELLIGPTEPSTPAASPGSPRCRPATSSCRRSQGPLPLRWPPRPACSTRRCAMSSG